MSTSGISPKTIGALVGPILATLARVAATITLNKRKRKRWWSRRPPSPSALQVARSVATDALPGALTAGAIAWLAPPGKVTVADADSGPDDGTD